MIVNRMGGGGILFASNIYSAASLPASGSDGDVCVISSDAIKQIQVSRTAPTTRADGTSRVSGDLWIGQGLTSNVSIAVVSASEGKVDVYPLFFAQWNGSSYVDKNAYKRISGSWVLLRKYLYAHGVINTPVIAGFTTVKEADMVLYDNTESIKSYWNGGMNIACWKYCNNQIDLTPYSNLKGIAWVQKQYNSGYWIAIGYLNRVPTTSDPCTAMTGYSAVSTLRSMTTLSLDVSAVNATRYIMACFNGCDGELYSWWLE